MYLSYGDRKQLDTFSQLHDQNREDVSFFPSARLLLEELQKDIGPGSPTGAAPSPTLALEALKKALRPQRNGGGAGGGDAYTRAKAKVTRRT